MTLAGPMIRPPDGRKSASLAKLRGAARELFVEHGYDQTRPQDIARLAGVASGTFYLHFADKKEAFLDFAEEAQGEVLAEYASALNGVTGHRNRWRAVFDVLEGFAERHPGVLQAAFIDPVFIAPRDEDAWRLYDRMGRFVSLALDEAGPNIDRSYDMELVSHGICGLLRHALLFAARKGIDRDKLIDDISRFIDKALKSEGETEEPA